MKMVLRMPFLPLSDADMGFAEQLGWRSYIMQRPRLLVATRRVEFFDRRGFAAAAVAQEGGPSYYCLKRLAPMQSPHPPHKFGDLANILATNPAAELSKWSAVSLLN